jgi:2-polyprenyl-6-hydroxyphenyl methylase/3-demethylubiquinone-9 3-methyltransferase
VARFSAQAALWWDPNGPFKPLHKFNPIRISVIRDWLCQHFGRDPKSLTPLSGLRLLDLGCGGGLVAEPLARMGASVLGVDASVKNIGTARAHMAALPNPLDLSYRATSVEDLAQTDAQFDAVLALEVVEHVADLSLFLTSAGKLVAPGGVLIAATLNRTAKSFVLAIVGAEYILGWLPRGTHQWSQFVTPQELAGHFKAAGVIPDQPLGFSYNPIVDRWRTGADCSVNYMCMARKDR